MIELLVQVIKEVVAPYDQGVLFLGLYIWQYVAILGIVVGCIGVTWFFLYLAKRNFGITGGRPRGFSVFINCIHYLACTGTLLYARGCLELPITPLWENIILFLLASFAMVSLIVVNKFIDIVFLLMDRKMAQANWNETGVLQLLKAIAKFITISFTFLLTLGFFFGSTPRALLQSVSIGAGTLTAVIALASKDMISNFFGALVVTIGKPFTIQDWIVINNLEGRVISINMRATQLRTATGTTIYVPNNVFITKHITNYGQSIYVPVSMQIVLIEADAKHLEAFLEGLKQLVAEYVPLKAKQCGVEVQHVGLKKARLVLHLYFNRMDQEDKIKCLREFIGQVMRLAKGKGIILED